MQKVYAEKEQKKNELAGIEENLWQKKYERFIGRKLKNYIYWYKKKKKTIYRKKNELNCECRTNGGRRTERCAGRCGAQEYAEN